MISLPSAFAFIFSSNPSLDSRYPGIGRSFARAGGRCGEEKGIWGGRLVAWIPWLQARARGTLEGWGQDFHGGRSSGEYVYGEGRINRIVAFRKCRVGGIWRTPTGHAPWDSVPQWVKVTKSYPTLCNPMGIVHRVLQARTVEWVSVPFSSGSSQLRDRTQVSCISGRFFTTWATREAQEYWSG